MTNPNPKPIPADKRGHRRTISPNDITVKYEIKMPSVAKKRLLAIGPERVRRLLMEFGEDQLVNNRGEVKG